MSDQESSNRARSTRPSGSGPAIALVLGGGGIAGYAFHCGAMAALEDLGFDPRTAELVIGTSAGAIAGALLRGGVRAVTFRDQLLAGIDDPVEIARIRLLAGRSRNAIPRVWTGPGSPGLALAELRKGRGLRLTRLAAGLLPRGRLELDPVSDPLATLLGDDWPSRPLWIPATDLASGRRVVFGRDLHPPVHQAVAASAALPGFFAPARVDDRAYVDGGIASPFNLDLIVEDRAEGGRTDPIPPIPPIPPFDLVVVSAPLSLARVDVTRPLDAAARTLPRRRLRREVGLVRGAGIPVLVLEPNRSTTRAMGLNPMDYKGLDGIIERAAAAVGTRLARAPVPVRSVITRARGLERPPEAAYPIG